MTQSAIGICPLTGKQSFATRADAKRALQLVNRCGSKAWRVYRCPVCSAFHLSSRRH
jgi:hypothetical protein